MQRRTSTRALPAWTAATVLLGLTFSCGASDRNLQGGEGGAGRDAGGGPSSGRSGTGRSGTGGQAGEVPGADAGEGQGGRDPIPPVPSDAGEGGGPPGVDPTKCTEEAARCAGNTPEVCTSGEWVAGPECGGATPACSNGACSAYRLNGHLTTVATSLETAAIRLVDHGFEAAPLACGELRGEEICVRGGLVP